ncbi:hypothetical protein ISN44_As04g005920 [Arabidopsis suecica]|uniref:Uncharacterized protein n=1 Tax=Arabidopsis suecica TaxID=45249 RepID=A0A8T2ECG5_ARASU|nr:hypothetical protein ISN44_As04g005920 [Arabidopsis suecica]
MYICMYVCMYMHAFCSKIQDVDRDHAIKEFKENIVKVFENII